MKKNKKNVKSKKFYVNEEKGVVVCVLEDIFGRAVGKARCDKRDVFNEETGKRLALLRAKIKKQDRKIKFINEQIECQTFILNDMKEDLQKETKMKEEMEQKLNLSNLFD